MKKALALVLVVCILASVGTLAASASNGTLLTTTATKGPDWVITELSPDQSGDGTGGYSDGKDCFEFIEIYNNSGVTLNLYDYCMTYNGVGRADTADRFEKQIVEITPFKAGNYLDGSELPFSDNTYTSCAPENLNLNPDTCNVAPGEIVVLWVLYCEAYYSLWNEGKGLSVADFRTFWQIPENVKVICVDGNSNTSRGGNDKNFNVKNSGTGTYGIALYTEAMNTAANTEPDGNVNFYPVVYTECPELASWATVDFTNQLGTSIANLTFNYTIDFQQYGAAEWDYTYDSRRMLLLEAFVEPTAGRLTTLQKMTLGVALDAGESIEFTDDIYFPTTELGKFQGFVIDGILYPMKSTFTADKAGVYNVQFKYEKDDIVVTGGETVAPETTKAPEPETTKAPEPETTKATTTAEITKAPSTAETTKKGGCGSVIGLGMLACILPAAVVICKKKH